MSNFRNKLNIYNTNRELINVESIGLYGINMRVPSPSYEVVTQRLDSGETIIVDRIRNPRTIELLFVAQANDYDDALRMRDVLFEYLGGNQLYVEEKRVLGKLWKIELAEWIPEFVNARTFSITTTGINYTDSETISIQSQTFITPTFTYQNQGNIVIDPRKNTDTEITFTGASSGLIIRNVTTGDEFVYNGATVAGDVLTLKNVRALKNGVSIFGETNKKIITFAPGRNEIEIENATGDFEVTIRSRFYFL